MIRDIILLLVLGILAFAAGRYTKKCPIPPDPTPIIKEVEVVRYKDKPIVKEVVKNVKEIVKVPYYTGECLDDAGLRAVNNLIESTAAGRADPRSTAPATDK